jgi:hypothetical protein
MADLFIFSFSISIFSKISQTPNLASLYGQFLTEQITLNIADLLIKVASYTVPYPTILPDVTSVSHYFGGKSAPQPPTSAGGNASSAANAGNPGSTNAGNTGNAWNIGGVGSSELKNFLGSQPVRIQSVSKRKSVSYSFFFFFFF